MVKIVPRDRERRFLEAEASMAVSCSFGGSVEHGETDAEDECCVNASGQNQPFVAFCEASIVVATCAGPRPVGLAAGYPD